MKCSLPHIVEVDLLCEFSQLVRFLKNNFEFSDHSFTHLAVTIWQDSMSRGQKS